MHGALMTINQPSQLSKDGMMVPGDGKGLTLCDANLDGWPTWRSHKTTIACFCLRTR